MTGAAPVTRICPAPGTSVATTFTGAEGSGVTMTPLCVAAGDVPAALVATTETDTVDPFVN